MWEKSRKVRIAPFQPYAGQPTLPSHLEAGCSYQMDMGTRASWNMTGRVSVQRYGEVKVPNLGSFAFPMELQMMERCCTLRIEKTPEFSVSILTGITSASGLTWGARLL